MNPTTNPNQTRSNQPHIYLTKVEREAEEGRRGTPQTGRRLQAAGVRGSVPGMAEEQARRKPQATAGRGGKAERQCQGRQGEGRVSGTAFQQFLSQFIWLSLQSLTWVVYISLVDHTLSLVQMYTCMFFSTRLPVWKCGAWLVRSIFSHSSCECYIVRIFWYSRIVQSMEDRIHSVLGDN